MAKADIDALMADHMAELDIPGAALTIVQGDEIVYTQGYGTADDSGRAVTPQTPFLIASVTKSFTAVGIMQLVEAGQLDLDQPVQGYLPWFRTDDPSRSAQITVRHLLHHTSGFDGLQSYLRNLEPDTPDALEASIRRLRDARLNRTPGTAFEYSNTNYDVLGLLIETVSGQSYEAYVREQILAPLEMEDSYTTMAEAQAHGGTSGYYPFFGVTVNYDGYMPYSRATRPSTGLWSSAEDLGHYLVAHLNGGRYGDAALVSPEGMALLHTPGATIEGDVQYTMGWTQFPFADAAPPDDPDAVPMGQSSGGRWPNYRALLFVVPEYDIGVALLMNANDPTHDSQFDHAGWNALLLALGRETVDYPPQEDFLARNGRTLLFALILLLLGGMVWSIRYLRRQPPGRPRLLWIVLPLVLEIGLALYSFFGRIEGPRELSLMLRSDAPDVGLMFLAVLVLTLGWGSLRTYLLLRNR